MENKDTRWRQRFQNFKRSLQYLELALQINEPDIIQKAGLIQFFEISVELAWNVVKDYLEDQGFTEIKIAAKRGIYFFTVHFTSCCKASIALARYTKGAFQLMAISLEA